MVSIVENLARGLDFLNPTSENFLLKGLFGILNPTSEDFLLNGIIKYLNPSDSSFIFNGLFGDINNIWTGLSQVVDWLNPLSENFFVYKFIELIGNLLKSLFVPRQESFTKIHNTFNARLGFVDVIKNGINELQQRLEHMENGKRSAYPSLSVNINSDWYTGEAVIFDCYWFAPYREHIHLFVSAFCYLFFMFRIYKHIPSIISGSSTFGGED